MKGSRRSSQLVLDRQGKDVPFGGSWLLDCFLLGRNKVVCKESEKVLEEQERWQTAVSISAPEQPRGLWETSSNLFNARDGLKAKTQLCSENLSHFLSQSLSSFCSEV